MRCSICDEEVPSESELFYGDKATYYEGKPVCETCYYEDEPIATVHFNNDDHPHTIIYTRSDTEGAFRAKWHRTDPWRGYYETESDEYVLVNTAKLLAYHESEKMLKKFDDGIRELFDEEEIEYARVFARSSNVFCQNCDLYVKKEQALLGGLSVARAKSEVDYGNGALFFL